MGLFADDKVKVEHTLRTISTHLKPYNVDVIKDFDLITVVDLVKGITNKDIKTLCKFFDSKLFKKDEMSWWKQEFGSAIFHII